MPTVLLRCVDSAAFRLADGSPLAAAATGDCTLLLPAPLCSITELAVGAGEASLLRKTLPWRLEDTLLAPPETLHFAHGAVIDGRTAVAIADRSALEQARTALADAGFTLTAAHAELALLPWQPRQWTLWADSGDRWLVRHGWHQGFACDIATLAAALVVLHNEQQTWPQQIACYATPEQAAALETVLPLSLLPLMTLRKPPAWDDLLAMATTANLMQGALAPPLPWRYWQQRWRWAVRLAAALFVIDAGFTLVMQWRLQSERDALEQQITNEFRQWQREGPMVDPVLQLRTLLTARGGGSQPLLPLLTRMVPALQRSSVAVRALDYDAGNGALQLDVESLRGFAAIEELRGSLQAGGLQAELIGSTSEGSTSRARLQVMP